MAHYEWFISLFLQVNSIFHMKRPFDLVSFLQQERRVEQLENLKEVLADTSSLDKVVDKHEPDLEARFYDTDSDCQDAGQPWTGVANLTSQIVINGQKVKIVW